MSKPTSSSSVRNTLGANMMKSLLLVAASLFLIADTALADGDVIAGEKVFQRCVGCHHGADNTHKQGPTLIGVVGRTVAGVQGF